MNQGTAADGQNMKVAAVLIHCVLSVALFATSTTTFAEEDRTGIEFFESHVRPLLVRRAVCHDILEFSARVLAT